MGAAIPETRVVNAVNGKRGSEMCRRRGGGRGRRTIAFAHRLNSENGDETTLAKVQEPSESP